MQDSATLALLIEPRSTVPDPLEVAMTIELWLATPDAASRFDAATLSPADAQRWSRVVNRTRRTEWQASRALLAHLGGRDAAATSLSHAFGHAAVAMAPPELAIGIDIEALRPRAVVELAAFAFSEREHAQLLASPPEGRLELFYLLWTLKEAAAKVLGLELFVALRQCIFYRTDGRWQGELPSDRPWTAWAFAPRANLLLAAVAVANVRAEMLPVTPIAREWPAARSEEWRPLLRVTGNSGRSAPAPEDQ